jgi:autotransporter-associated beta strand protein
LIDTIHFGTEAMALGSTASTVGIVSTGVNIGNITFGAAQASPVTLGTTGALGTITLTAASTITLNNTSDSIGVVLAGAATSMTKAGAGTLTLTGASTYAGTTMLSGGGSLVVGNGSSGSLNGTTGTALTFNAGGGLANFQEAASSTQGMGALTFSAGEASLISTAATGSSTATLTFASLAARGAGATGNFSLATNTTASENKIVLTSTTNAPLSNSGSDNSGIFFGGTDYARYDMSNLYLRAASYGSDTNANALVSGTTIGTVTSATDVKLNGNITAQTTKGISFEAVGG